ncbi:hypothetical protein [Planctopirus hydrillae]|uniref:ABC transporter permease n=1 Tax=Planctopirus hydrillae TaxID=1841610 RepID=A0A1C3EBZ1_9PLAN|nr:hypothetical protein [Planctopirus hydrillae]ODA30762.1 hypothetical protein A6X21_05630 [Planctopirus hydrillae]
MDFLPDPFPLLSAFLQWLAVIAVIFSSVLLITFTSNLVSNGAAGAALYGQSLGQSLVEIFSTSVSRCYALAKLTFTEAIRRKALFVFVVFAVLFMFAGWFLSDPDQSAKYAKDAVKIHVTFILNVLTWLTMIVMLLLACIGIPEDIRLRSIHTVVTKPARRFEIVLSRILGYVGVGTVLLGIMSVTSLVWIYRQVPVSARSELTARQPIWGQLSFLDRTGNKTDAGINVGDIWAYRSYIEGATKSRAIWRFENVTPAMLTTMTDDDGKTYEALRLESRIEAFRSHKGNMDRTTRFQYIILNPERNLEVTAATLEIGDEFSGRTDGIRRTLIAETKDNESKTVDLINDLVAKDGSLTIAVACTDPGQYLGMARSDLFIRLPDAPFAVTFFKAILGIWLFMVLTVTLGVTASTFVKGPFAIMMTFTFLTVSITAREFIRDLLSGKLKGGGAFESAYRIPTYMNDTTDLPSNPGTQLIKWVDWVMNGFLWLIQQILPNVSYFNMTGYVANGFDVDNWNTLLPAVLVTIGYFIPCVLIGYYCLRSRELEAK